jgi:1-acyl-sn-glycerol-3-phosphate acyltransferase
VFELIAGLRVALAGIVILVASILLMPWQLLALRFDWKLRRRLPRVWHRIVCCCLGIRIRVHGKMETHRPLMLCANHSSWMDIMVLSAIADVAFIAKVEVRDWPIFGTLAKLQKSVFIVREEKRKTGHQANEIAARMADGEIVVLFPEGTTSDGNRLLEVKSSLFGAAAWPYRHRQPASSSCSRLRSPIPASTACRWGGIIAPWHHGPVMSRCFRI